MKAFLLLGLIALTGCTSIATKIVIDAPPSEVRKVLYGFEQYPVWNPFIVKVSGAVAEGNKVNVTVHPVGKAEISGETTIVAFTDQHLVWSGSLTVPGIFHGEHEFIIEDLGAGKTLFHNSEKMSGLVIPFYDFKPTQRGFEAMNEALKKTVEAKK